MQNCFWYKQKAVSVILSAVSQSHLLGLLFLFLTHTSECLKLFARNQASNFLHEPHETKEQQLTHQKNPLCIYEKDKKMQDESDGARKSYIAL